MNDTSSPALCPFCKAEILEGATKCRYCGEFLPRRKSVGTLTFVQSHLALIATVGLSLLVVLKLLVVSRLQVSTALTLLQVSGIGQVVSGVVITSLPLIVLVTAYIGMWFLVIRAPWASLITMIAVDIVGFAFLPMFWSLFLLLTTGPFFVNVYFIRRRRSEDKSPEGSPFTIYAGLLFLSLLLLAGMIVLFNPSVWLPAERVVLDNQDLIVAYVVGNDGQWTTLLVEEDRSIIRVATDDIARRKSCRTGSLLLIESGGWQTESVLQWIMGWRSPDPLCTPSQ